MFWNRRKEQEECKQNLKKAKEKIIRDAEIKLMFDIDMIVSNWYYRYNTVYCQNCNCPVDKVFYEIYAVEYDMLDCTRNYDDINHWKIVCDKDKCKNKEIIFYNRFVGVLEGMPNMRIIKHNQDGSYELEGW